MRSRPDDDDDDDKKRVGTVRRRLVPGILDAITDPLPVAKGLSTALASAWLMPWRRGMGSLCVMFVIGLALDRALAVNLSTREVV